jgi:hypothetical protein
MGFFNPPGEFADRMNVFRVTDGLLPEGVEDSIILPLKVPVNSHREPTEDRRDSHA